MANECRSVWQLARLSSPARTTGPLHRPLHGILVQVMPTDGARAWVVRNASAGEEILPREFTRRGRILFRQRFGKYTRPAPRPDRGRVIAAALDGGPQAVRAARQATSRPVDVSFAAAHENLTPIEIEVLHPQAAGFRQSQSAAVHQANHEPVHSRASPPASTATRSRAASSRTETVGNGLRRAARTAARFGNSLRSTSRYKKRSAARGLILRRRRDSSLDGQMR